MRENHAFTYFKHKKKKGSGTGGNEIIESEGYRIHLFRASGTFEVEGTVQAEYLIVAGGGSGESGGGGAGGHLKYVAQEENNSAHEANCVTPLANW